MMILFMVCMPKPMARFAVYVKAVLMLIRVLLGQYTAKVILSPNFAKILAAFNNL